MRTKLIITAIIFPFVFASAVFAADLGTDAEKAAGKKLYEAKCSQCHGLQGDGKGIATPFLRPEPRDFTRAMFKFRTTASGELPRDKDIIRSIRNGMPATGMPAWPEFSDSEVHNLMVTLKTFSPDFADPDYNNPKEVKIPGAPSSSEESIKRGRTVFENNECIKCHGQFGRGDGPSAPTMVDDWGKAIRPADLTKPWTFRSGPKREDIFKAISTGLNGTPMPSFGDTIEETARWDLVHYIASLAGSEEARYSNYVEAQSIEGNLDLSKGKEIFKNARAALFPIIGQIIEPGREFQPAAHEIEVKAVYNADDIALSLSWHNMTAETSGSNAPDLTVSETVSGAGSADSLFADAPAPVAETFSDAVAVQFPSTWEGGIKKPYFIFGDKTNPIDLWFADLAQAQPLLFQAKGSQSIRRIAGEIGSVASYEHGKWNVLFKRKRASESGPTFEEGSFVPITFSIWDGANSERGSKRGLSSWTHLYLKPAEQPNAVIPAAKAGGITFLALLGFVYLARRKVKSK